MAPMSRRMERRARGRGQALVDTGAEAEEAMTRSAPLRRYGRQRSWEALWGVRRARMDWLCGGGRTSVRVVIWVSGKGMWAGIWPRGA